MGYRDIFFGGYNMYGGRNEVVAVCKDICANRFRKYKTGLKEYMVVTRDNNVYTDAYTYFIQIFNFISGYIGDDVFDIYNVIINRANNILCILRIGDNKELSAYDVVYNHMENGSFLYKPSSADNWQIEKFYTFYQNSKFNDDKFLQGALELYIKSLNDVLKCLSHPSKDDCIKVLDSTMDSIRNMEIKNVDDVCCQKKALDIYQVIKHAVFAFYK